MEDINNGIKSALGQYQADTGAFPKSLEDLLKQSGSVTHWHGPYMDRLPIDPWGNPYHYIYPGLHNRNSYDLFSAGPDQQIGTEDDIDNW